VDVSHASILNERGGDGQDMTHCDCCGVGSMFDDRIAQKDFAATAAGTGRHHAAAPVHPGRVATSGGCHLVDIGGDRRDPPPPARSRLRHGHVDASGLSRGRVLEADRLG
jgi:hypothetical protein